MKYGALLTIIALVFIAGCLNWVPKTVPRDRFDYNTAIGDSWKGQMLLSKDYWF